MLPLDVFCSLIVLCGIFCVLAMLAFAWLAKGISAGRFEAFDNRILTGIYSYRGPVNDQIMLAFTTLGESLLLGSFIVVAVVALWRAGRRIDAVGLIIASAGAGLLNQALKLAFHRIRPNLFPGPFLLTTYSFPSGHAMGALACYGMLAFVGMRLLRRCISKILLIGSTMLLVMGVGLSRVYFGVHYPTDVLGGYIASAIWLAISIGVARAAEWHASSQGCYQPAGLR